MTGGAFPLCWLVAVNCGGAATGGAVGTMGGAAGGVLSPEVGGCASGADLGCRTGGSWEAFCCFGDADDFAFEVLRLACAGSLDCDFVRTVDFFFTDVDLAELEPAGLDGDLVPDAVLTWSTLGVDTCF